LPSPLCNLARRRFLRLSLATGAGVAACAYPFVAEHRLVRINRYRIPVPRLPEAFRGFTIAQLTDLHHGPLVPASFLRRVVEHTLALGADLVALTGDYITGTEGTGSVDSVWDVLGPLHAPAGVHAVLGNHDFGQMYRSRDRLDASGWSLHGRVQPLRRNGQTLWLAGAGDFRRDHLPLDPLLDQIPPDDCRVVLAHNPDTADTRRSGRVDLFVTGHTHGGQVRLPFLGAPVLPVRNKTYSSGLKTSPRGEPVFICRGIGWSILPVRFLCPPELAVLELVPGPEAAT
jgi:predicted MPP superfamily phosphohydrolase